MKWSNGWSLGLVALGIAGCGGITEPAESQDSVSESVLTYEEFRAQAFQEPGTGIFIVDGDLPIENEAALREVYADYVRDARAEASGLGTQRSNLIVNTVGGADDRWAYNRQRSIPYCVSTAFGGNYGAVVNAMQQATSAWRSANVYFQYLPDQDGSCTAANNNVIFDVNPVNVGGAYLARAFFPSNARASRNVLIDNTAFGAIAPYTLAGILRHELGHTLGFRHEHTRPEARACFEDNNWRALTGYDAASVMHYPQCNGTNRGDLNLTATDNAGLLALYGPLAEAGIDPVFYLNTQPDLLNAFGRYGFTAARNHFFSSGINELRRGSSQFDVQFYLAAYGDLRAAFGTNYGAALNHWINNGINEGRRGSYEFDVQFYLAFNPDLRAAFGNNYGAALNHWVTAGIYEGRRASAEFDVKAYLARYPDVQAAYGARNYPAALDHWITSGRAQGRNGAP